MDDLRITVVLVAEHVAEHGVDRNLDVVHSVLRERWPTTTITVSMESAAKELDDASRRVFDRFTHTPQPLIDSWLVSQAVRASVDPGTVVVMSDRGGAGGVLALAEASHDPHQRRIVWTAAGSGLTVESMLVSGTIEHLDLPEAAIVDWELVQMQYSAEVLVTGAAAAASLSRFGITTGMIVPEPKGDARSEPVSIGTVWVPGPVRRRNRSGDVLRALAPLPGVSVTVSDEDASDDVWTGTTWDSLSGPRGLLGDRLRRSANPPEIVDAVIVGDALAPPDPQTIALHDTGTPVLAARGSVADAMWTDAMVWDTADELAALVEGGGDGRPSRHEGWSGPRIREAMHNDRARRVSVGVPIYGSSPYLDACIESVLDQSEAPHEVLVMDDGSASPVVTERVATWVARSQGRVRLLDQPNRGVCVARNRMIEAMTGDAFVLVDQDDVLDPRFIERTASSLRSNPGVSAVATWTEFFGEYEGIEAKPPFDVRVGLRENPIVSTAVLVDISVREEGIAFAPDLAFIYCEDWHFWSQIIASGRRMGLVPEPLVRHRVHRESGGFRRTDLALRIGRARSAEILVRGRLHPDGDHVWTP